MQRLKKGKWSAFIRKINFCVYAINITELIYSRKFNYVIIQLYLRYLLQWIILFIYFLIQFLIYIYFFKIFQHQLIIYHWTLPSQQFIALPLPHSPSSPLSLSPTLSLPHSPSSPLSLSPTLSLPHSPSFHSPFHPSFLFHFLQGRPNQRNEIPQGSIFEGA